MTKPNCPLATGVRPCECEGIPRCPICNYTEHDAAFELDHAACPGRIPDEGRETAPSDTELYEQDTWAQGEDVDSSVVADLARQEVEEAEERLMIDGIVRRGKLESYLREAIAILGVRAPESPVVGKWCAEVREFLGGETLSIAEGLPGPIAGTTEADPVAQLPGWRMRDWRGHPGRLPSCWSCGAKLTKAVEDEACPAPASAVAPEVL